MARCSHILLIVPYVASPATCGSSSHIWPHVAPAAASGHLWQHRPHLATYGITDHIGHQQPHLATCSSSRHLCSHLATRGITSHLWPHVQIAATDGHKLHIMSHIHILERIQHKHLCSPLAFSFFGGTDLLQPREYFEGNLLPDRLLSMVIFATNVFSVIEDWSFSSSGNKVSTFLKAGMVQAKTFLQTSSKREQHKEK